MTAQKEFTLTPRRRGFHLVTEEIIRNLPPLPSAGILHLFIKHTSAGLTINENADPDVQTDMEAIFNRLVKEREPYYQHTCEGDDDMPAHAKATLSGTSLTIPITNGRLNIGIWQGIYLCEFRNRGGGQDTCTTRLAYRYCRQKRGSIACPASHRTRPDSHGTAGRYGRDSDSTPP